jgi:hypothetical protein
MWTVSQPRRLVALTDRGHVHPPVWLTTTAPQIVMYVPVLSVLERKVPLCDLADSHKDSFHPDARPLNRPTETE